MTSAIVWLNSGANAGARVILAPIAFLPGWLSATLVAAGTGFVALAAFKYLSDQKAIAQVRRDIQASLLALSLFRDEVGVSLRAQGRIIAGAGRLFLLSLVPLAAMALPMTLLLAQLALWYQFRPLRAGEQAVVALTLAGTTDSDWPDVRLEESSALRPLIGPVRIRSQRRVCWTIEAREAGVQRLVFDVNGRKAEKEIAVGDGFLRTSPLRPGWNWADALLYPAESPFAPDSPVHSIAVEMPGRAGWTCGSDSWVWYWAGMSFVFGLASRRFLKVHV